MTTRFVRQAEDAGCRAMVAAVHSSIAPIRAARETFPRVARTSWHSEYHHQRFASGRAVEILKCSVGKCNPGSCQNSSWNTWLLCTNVEGPLGAFSCPVPFQRSACRLLPLLLPLQVVDWHSRCLNCSYKHEQRWARGITICNTNYLQ